MGIDAEGVLLEESENGWKICSWAIDLPRTTLGPKYSLLSHLTLGCASKNAEQVEVQKKEDDFKRHPLSKIIDQTEMICSCTLQQVFVIYLLKL